VPCYLETAPVWCLEHDEAVQLAMLLSLWRAGVMVFRFPIYLEYRLLYLGWLVSLLSRWCGVA